MNKLFWILTVIYVLSPIDFLPGPVDDILLIAAAFYINAKVKDKYGDGDDLLE